jgi:hypothetical protein
MLGSSDVRSVLNESAIHIVVSHLEIPPQKDTDKDEYWWDWTSAVGEYVLSNLSPLVHGPRFHGQILDYVDYLRYTIANEVIVLNGKGIDAFWHREPTTLGSSSQRVAQEIPRTARLS